MIDNMEHNLTFKEELKKFKELDKDQYSLLLRKFKKKYKDYRLSWFENPKKLLKLETLINLIHFVLTLKQHQYVIWHAPIVLESISLRQIR